MVFFRRAGFQLSELTEVFVELAATRDAVYACFRYADHHVLYFPYPTPYKVSELYEKVVNESKQRGPITEIVYSSVM
jgi:hypothetical protein